MKVLIVLIFIVGLTSYAVADDNAALQMRLANDPNFQSRISYILMREAFIVLNESTSVPNHANRFAFALRVKDSVSNIISNGYAIALVGRPNLVAEVTTCDGEGICTTSATDAEIASQIATDWNLWSNNQ